MKAIRFHAHGGLDQIVYEEIENATAKAGEYLKRVKAVALNGFDPMILSSIPASSPLCR